MLLILKNISFKLINIFKFVFIILSGCIFQMWIHGTFFLTYLFIIIFSD